MGAGSRSPSTTGRSGGSPLQAADHVVADPGQHLGRVQQRSVGQILDDLLEGGDHIEDLVLAQSQRRAETAEGLRGRVGGHGAAKPDGRRGQGDAHGAPSTGGEHSEPRTHRVRPLRPSQGRRASCSVEPTQPTLGR